jgi:hypothetical protein
MADGHGIQASGEEWWLSASGLGFLYFSTPPDTRWSLLHSADNHDYDSIEYHAANDSYYALEPPYEGAPVIHHLSADGIHLDGAIRLPMQPFTTSFFPIIVRNRFSRKIPRRFVCPALRADGRISGGAHLPD